MNSLLTYILRRLLLVPVTLAGITVVVFAIARMAPEVQEGGLGAEGGGLAGAKGRERSEEYYRKRMHLDEPIYAQYFLWLADLSQNGLGFSKKHNRPVIDLIAERLPVTLSLNVVAFVIAYVVAIPLGMASAAQHNRAFDRVATAGTFLLYSLPAIWVGSSLLGYLANPEYLNWFPTGDLKSLGAERMLLLDRVRDVAWHMVLPAATLSFAGFAYLSRQMRAGMLDVLRQDYIRTARAKGLPPSTVLVRHALANSLLPVITVMASLLPGLIAGSVIVERIFSINGMGGLAFDAISNRDYEVIQAIAAVAGLLNITGLLLADIAYAMADPRISYD
jgi:peptide/nickel transport system permease protein